MEHDYYDWNDGGTSQYGLGGMRIFDGQTRTTERRIKEHPDGTREIIETIVEKNVSSRYVSAKTDRQYKIGMASFERQNKALIAQSLPLHSLLLMRDSVVEDLSKRFANLLPTTRK